MRVTKPMSVTGSYKGEFELLLEIKNGENKISTEVISGPGSSFSGIEKGFEIFWYRSPDNLPLREPLVAKITVTKADPIFVSRYGKTKLAIRKLSDE